jgi:hypothetical protein
MSKRTIYYIEVSYKIPKGIFKYDKEIIRTVGYSPTSKNCNSGYRNLIFAFDDPAERKDCLDKFFNFKDYCVCFYEKYSISSE